jgi:hypothetical protein
MSKVTRGERSTIWLGSCLPEDQIDSVFNPWAKLYYYNTLAQARTGSPDYVTLMNDTLIPLYEVPELLGRWE